MLTAQPLGCFLLLQHTMSILGALLAVPLHPEDLGQGEGREAEAVAAAGPPGQGAQVAP